MKLKIGYLRDKIWDDMQYQSVFEKAMFKIYNSEEKLIGKIKIGGDKVFNESEFFVENKKYQVIQNKWKTQILEDGEIHYHLRTDPIWGNMEILETQEKLKGCWGLKWDTQLVDSDDNCILKIRNENKFIQNGKSIIKTEIENPAPLKILISLYAHLFASNLKTNGAVLGLITAGTV